MTDPTLRELLEQRINFEQDLRELTIDMMDRALALQHKEYERRLESLNDAHTKAVVEQARTLPRETWELWREDHNRWRESVNLQLTRLTVKAALAGGAVGIAVQVLLWFWGKP